MEEPKKEAAPLTPERPLPDDPPGLKGKITKVLRTVYDPEIPVNIYELGLIYKLDVDEEKGSAEIFLTLTSPACPVAGSLPPEVENKIKAIEEVNDVKVVLVWEPAWNPSMMTQAAKLKLNLM